MIGNLLLRVIPCFTRLSVS